VATEFIDAQRPRADLFHQKLEEIHSTTSSLEGACRVSAQFQTAFQLMMQKLGPSLDKFASIEQTMRQPFSLMLIAELSQIRDDLMPGAASFDKEIRKFISLAQEAEDQERQRHQKLLAGHIVTILAASILVNVGITLVVGIFLYRSVISRLRIIQENTHRLVSHTTLNPPLPGGDEIAELDQDFHIMANRLAR